MILFDIVISIDLSVMYAVTKNQSSSICLRAYTIL